MQSTTIIVGPEHAGERLDRFLALNLPDISRSRIQALIAAGEVIHQGAPITEAKRKVKEAESYTLNVPAPEDATPQAEAIPLHVVYEDDDLIVINKQRGLVVHPAQGNWTGTLVNALLSHCGESLSGVGGVRRPGIVHRLDKDTTGLMVVAKNDKAHQGLSEQFAAHGRDGRMQRAYRALIWGRPELPRGSISAPLARHSTNRLKMAVAKAGKQAVTHYEVLQSLAAAGNPTLVDCILETGRTHQIRVHMAHIGHPLLGDGLYSRGFATMVKKLSPEQQQALDDFGRQALHAWLLGFDHPVTGEPMEFEADIPDDMQILIKALNRPSE